VRQRRPDRAEDDIAARKHRCDDKGLDVLPKGERYPFNLAAGGRNTIEGGFALAAEDDGIAGPHPSGESAGHRAHDPGGAAAHRGHLDAARHVEGEVAAVGREERRPGGVRAVDANERRRTEWAKEELGIAGLVLTPDGQVATVAGNAETQEWVDRQVETANPKALCEWLPSRVFPGAEPHRQRGHQRTGGERHDANSDQATDAAAGLYRSAWLVAGRSEIEADVTDVPISGRLVALQTPRQYPADTRRCRGRQAVQLDVRVKHGANEIAEGLAGERAPASKHLVQDTAEREDVAALVHRPSPGLLGRHVAGRAHDDAGSRRRRKCRGREGGRVWGNSHGRSGRSWSARQPEIEDLHATVRRHHDVGRLQVAVNDSLLVRGLERSCDAVGNRNRLVHRDRSPGEPRIESLALDVFQDQVLLAVGLLEAVDAGDIRMRECRERLCLALEARQAIGIVGQRVGQRLDGDRPVQTGVVAQIDDAHAAAPELAVDPVGSKCGGLWRHEGKGYVMWPWRIRYLHRGPLDRASAPHRERSIEAGPCAPGPGVWVGSWRHGLAAPARL
jgi:hypothetical protein